MLIETHFLCSLKGRKAYKVTQIVFLLTGHVTFEAKYRLSLEQMVSTWELLSSMWLLGSVSPCWESIMCLRGRLLKNLNLQLWEEVRQPALWRSMFPHYPGEKTHSPSYFALRTFWAPKRILTTESFLLKSVSKSDAKYLVSA